MRKMFFSVLCLAVIVSGCTVVQVPMYLPDDKVFTQRVYVDFETALNAVRMAVADFQWDVSSEVPPEMYEVDSESQTEKEILLITDIKNTHLFVGSRYARMNIYIRSTGAVSEIEFRYMVVNSMVVWKPRTYGSQNLADRFFARVESHL